MIIPTNAPYLMSFSTSGIGRTGVNTQNTDKRNKMETRLLFRIKPHTIQHVLYQNPQTTLIWGPEKLIILMNNF